MFLSKIPQELSPLSPEQTAHVQQLAGAMTPVQQAWVSGYLAASANNNRATMPVVAAPVVADTLTVLYGSQTGNSKHVAQNLARKAEARGLTVKLTDMADYKPNLLKKEKFVAMVVSTYGEGAPPESAEVLFDFLSSKRAPKLDGLQIAVLGLGDSSYEYFNKSAIDFEARLTRLGAKSVFGRALLDVDYEDLSEDWTNRAIDAFEQEINVPQEVVSNVLPIHGTAPQITAPTFDKRKPFNAEISTVQRITGRNSSKDTRHVEISLEGSGLTYRSGDSLGVYFLNDQDEVDGLLNKLEINANQIVQIGNDQKPIRAALIEDLELTQSYPSFVEKYAVAVQNDELGRLAQDKKALRAYIADRQIFDILRDHSATINAQDLADCLRKVQPRLYSISSSQAEFEEEVHVTVGVVEYDAYDRTHLGGCSGFLGRRAAEDDSVRVFIESNDHFRLPENPETATIMIGPGTGVAPFRSFLQERDVTGAKGKNWLFFGNQHFTQDFLYQVEMLSYLKSGVLDKISLAFSRDQDKKIYVQDRILENGAELYQWLEKGAYLYVCGDAKHMAKDVHQALVKAIEINGNVSADAAEEYLRSLRDMKRYQRDVY